MALCQYCGKVEIAWHAEGGRYVAYAAKQDAAGKIEQVQVEAKTGSGRTVMRNAPDLTRRHYPEGECGGWSTSKAAERAKEAGLKSRTACPTCGRKER